MKIVLSGALVRFTDYTKEIDIEATTLAEGVERLTDRFPHLKNVLLDGEGRVRRTHQLFLNGEQVERGDFPLGTAPHDCGERDTLFVLTAVAGG
jgi:sulfur-carrier protein